MLSWHNTNVSGDIIAYCRNAKHCFNVAVAENLAYCQFTYREVRDCYDFSNWGDKCELMYEVFGSGLGCRNVKFAWDCWPANQELEYCFKCGSSNNLFGCVGLKKKSYCIFNKQYSRDDFAALREKIIRHMHEMSYTDRQGRIYSYGEFFPPELSPFMYNETLAQDLFPLTKESAQANGFKWRDPVERQFQITIDAVNLPDHIRDIKDSVVQEIIRCMFCGRVYRVIQMELEFLRKLGLPLPRSCPDCRYRKRIAERNPPRFYPRRCTCGGSTSENGVYRNITTHPTHATDQHCPNEFETSYAPNRQEIVYCEECYQAEAV